MEGRKLLMKKFLSFAVFVETLLFSTLLSGQVFTKITDTANPIVNDPGPGGYSGASWIDYDNDDDLDLFINNTFLYRNDGSGVFAKITSTLGATQAIATGNGQTWGDYDNDGNIDVFIASTTSTLYRNNGNGTFKSITGGDIGNATANRGWAAAWADPAATLSVEALLNHDHIIMTESALRQAEALWGGDRAATSRGKGA